MRKLILSFSIILALALGAYGQNAKEYFEKGRAKYQLGDYGGVIRNLSKAIELDPLNAMYFGLRGAAKSIY